jgi:hypothetical protein
MVGQSLDERSSSGLETPERVEQTCGPASRTVSGGSCFASRKSLSILGFLTVIDVSPHGLFGGYLVVNTSGRPLEFHCTEPVKPSRAQQILYGPTLAPFLYSEQIGQALFAKARQAAPLVLTDVVPALDLRNFIDVPVVLVPAARGADQEESSDSPAITLFHATEAGQRSVAATRIDGPHGGLGAELVAVQVAAQQVALAVDQQADAEWLERDLGAVAQRFDLTEPFTRIRAAICEAQRIQ